MDGGPPPPQPPPPPLLAQQMQPPVYHPLLYSQQQLQQQGFPHPQLQHQLQQNQHQRQPQLQQQLQPQQLSLPPNYPSAPRLPKKRTRTGCLTCRKRKHKCGEERPHCARCLRAGMECVWPPEGSGSGSSTGAGTAASASSAAAAGSSSSTTATTAESAKAKARPYPPPHKRASSSSSSTRTTAGPGVLSRGTSGDRSGSFGTSAGATAGGGGPTAQTSTASSTTSSPRPLGHPHLFHPSPGQQQPYYSSSGAFFADSNGRSPHPLSQDPAGMHHPSFASPATSSSALGQSEQLQTVVLNQPTYPILSPFAPQHQHQHHPQQHSQLRLNAQHAETAYADGLQRGFGLTNGNNGTGTNAEAGPSRLAANGPSSINGNGSNGSTLGLADFEAYFAGYTADQWAAMLDPAIGSGPGRLPLNADDGGLLLNGTGLGGLANGLNGGSYDHSLLHQQHQQAGAPLGSGAGGVGLGTDPSVLDLHAAWLALDASSSAAMAAADPQGANEPSPSLWLHSSPSPAAILDSRGAGGGGIVDEPDQLGNAANGQQTPPVINEGGAATPATALKWARTPSPSAANALGRSSSASTAAASPSERMTGIEVERADSAGSTPRGRPLVRSSLAQQQHAVKEPSEPVKVWSPSQWQMLDEDEDESPPTEGQQQQQQQSQQQEVRQQQHLAAPGVGQVSLPRYTTPTSSLVLLFPNPEERHLMQHFLYSVPALFVGIQASSQIEMEKFATEEHPNLNSFFPFLDIPHFLSLPRGQSSAADALALSLMSVGAGRLSHLYHSEAGEDPSVEGNSRRYSQLSVSLMQASLGLGQTSLAFARLKGKGVGASLAIGSTDGAPSQQQQQQQQQQQGMDDSEITHLLAACSSCILARCLAGGRGFEGALDLARGVVEFAGGPKKMLDALSSSGSTTATATASSAPSGSATITSLDPPPSTPYAAGGSLGASSLTTPTTTSKATRRKRLRMLRSVLEDLASWDLFASLSSGAKPSAFSSSSPHSAGSGGGLAEWLFAYSPPSGTREGTSGEEDWETLESTLGFSRILMDLFSRVNVLYATSRSPATSSSEPQTATLAIQLLHEIRIRKADVLRSYPELAQPFFPGPSRGDDLEAEEELGRRVRYGRLGRDDEHEGEGLGRGKAKRLQFGDLIWTLTLEIMVRTEVQNEPTESAEIKALADRIVTLVQEAHRRSLVTLGFLWPLIIAGTMFDIEADRQAALSAIETLRSYTCFDLQSGQEILREVWTARDAGDRRATFRDVAPRCGTVVL